MECNGILDWQKLKVRGLNWQNWKLEDWNEKKWKLEVQICIFAKLKIERKWNMVDEEKYNNKKSCK